MSSVVYCCSLLTRTSLSWSRCIHFSWSFGILFFHYAFTLAKLMIDTRCIYKVQNCNRFLLFLFSFLLLSLFYPSHVWMNYLMPLVKFHSARDIRNRNRRVLLNGLINTVCCTSKTMFLFFQPCLILLFLVHHDSTE